MLTSFLKAELFDGILLTMIFPGFLTAPVLPSLSVLTAVGTIGSPRVSMLSAKPMVHACSATRRATTGGGSAPIRRSCSHRPTLLPRRRTSTFLFTSGILPVALSRDASKRFGGSIPMERCVIRSAVLRTCLRCLRSAFSRLMLLSMGFLDRQTTVTNVCKKFPRLRQRSRISLFRTHGWPDKPCPFSLRALWFIWASTALCALGVSSKAIVCMVTAIPGVSVSTAVCRVF